MHLLHNIAYISSVAVKNKLNIELDYEKKVVEYIYDNFEYLLECKPSKINFQNIYNDNIKHINEDELDGKLDLISLLFFEDSSKILREYINNKQIDKKVSINSNKKTNNVENTNEHIQMTNVKLKTPTYNNKTKNKTPHKYSDNTEKKKKEKGYSAEELVYIKLLSIHGNDSVIWSSKTNDSLGFDIKYKNKENQWKFVEVKTFNGYQFYITENEKNFANSNLGDYEIFLVKDQQIYVVTDINFDDSSRFILEPNQYIVKYSIQL